jgi:glycosyltransferase involved in cell wall biosynthesis
VTSNPRTKRVLALLPWGHVIEDFLVPNRLSLEDFCTDFTGSWMFGWVEALRTAGIETVLIVVSKDVRHVTRRIHRATGAPISVIPAPQTYRAARSRIAPYGRTVAHAFGGPRALRLALYPALFLAKEVAPYLSTPVRKLHAELNYYGCDALLCQEYEFPRFDVCAGLGRIHRIPVFACFQGGDYQRWQVERLVRPLSMRSAEGFIVAPATEVERIRGKYAVQERRIAMIPNPVDVDVWHPRDRLAARQELGIAHDARVAAWHGRVELRKKGLDSLVDAWARVTEQRLDRNLALLLIGTGADVNEVRALLAERRLENVIWIDRYLHDPAEIARLLAAADVYAFPSRFEGFPLAPVEAMACGLPVVSTDASGIRQILPKGYESGGVVVRREAAADFALELGRLLDDEEFSREVGRRARLRAQAFAAPAIGASLRSFIFAPEHTPRPHL